jgi:hypothetical protein
MADGLTRVADNTHDLLRLADSVEKATGPDPMLDLAVYQAVTGKEGIVRCMGREGISAAVPAYTASLDAATTLIPAWLTPTITGHEQSCRLLNGIGFPVRGTDHFTQAATLPLAITAAALKARAHSTKESDNG